MLAPFGGGCREYLPLNLTFVTQIANMSTSGASTGNDVASHETPYRPQFGLSALLWTVGVIGMTLAYLRRFDSPTVFPNAFAAVGASCLIGAAVGWWPRRMADATYWAIVITTAAYLSVIGDRRFDPTFHFAWAAVGAATGACCGAMAPNRLFRRMLAGGFAAAAIMLVFVQVGSLQDRTFDLFCAPVVALWSDCLSNSFCGSNAEVLWPAT